MRANSIRAAPNSITQHTIHHRVSHQGKYRATDDTHRGLGAQDGNDSLSHFSSASALAFFRFFFSPLPVLLLLLLSVRR